MMNTFPETTLWSKMCHQPEKRLKPATKLQIVSDRSALCAVPLLSITGRFSIPWSPVCPLQQTQGHQLIQGLAWKKLTAGLGIKPAYPHSILLTGKPILPLTLYRGSWRRKQENQSPWYPMASVLPMVWQLHHLGHLLRRNRVCS